MTETTLLSDLGERRLIEEVLHPRYSSGGGLFGDDCASLPLPPPGSSLVWTTDPCPVPMAALLGLSDLYYRGWLLSTINLSDLAAAGARPLGLLTSLILPSHLPLSDFVRLLDGIDACCASNSTAVLGGNLKEGVAIDVQATALGAVPGTALSRTGRRAGDVLALAGPAGSFWAGSLSRMSNVPLPDGVLERLLVTVLTPSPQLKFGQALRASGLSVSVMDNSDGLGPCLWTLGALNHLGSVIDLSGLSLERDVATAAEALEIDAARLIFGWGDWNILVAVGERDYSALERLAAECRVSLMPIGNLTADPSHRVVRGGSELVLQAPDSQRFASDSWFSVGIDAYVEALKRFPLP